MSTRTISRVLRANEVLSAFMREQCALVAEYGGSFAVRDFYEGGWFTEYTIDWPTGFAPMVVK